MKRKISVIVPSFNSGRTIEYTLKALDLQAERNLLSEIIVVDSSNDRETKKLLSEYESDRLKVITPGIRIMPSISRNIGAREAREEILAFLDSDVYPARDWLRNIAGAFENGCLVGGGGIGLAEFQKNKPIALAQYYLQFNEYIDRGINQIKKFVPSCNMFCLRELFRKAGGFPEIRAAEDVLFGLKMSEFVPVWFIPGARVNHIFRRDWRLFLKNQILLGEYVSIYRKSYYRSFIYKGIMPFVLFPGFLGVKLVRIISRVSQAGLGHIYRLIMVFPVFLIGLFFWSSGFVKGLLSFKRKNF